MRSGVEAVIDKDLTNSPHSKCTWIQGYHDPDRCFSSCDKLRKKPEQQELGQITVSEAKKYFEEGQFPAGSMGPKIEAAIRFIEGGGKRATIGHLEEALPTLLGKAGTHNFPDQ